MPEHERLEADIKALAEKVGEAIEQPRGNGREHKEILRKALRETFSPGAAPPPTVTSEPSSAGTAPADTGFLPGYAARA